MAIGRSATTLTKPIDHSSPLPFEIDAIWESPVLTAYEAERMLPANELVPGRAYRVRAQMKGGKELWSPWSAPVTFVAGYPTSGPTAKHRLVLQEIMYHPKLPTEAEASRGWAEEDFEYLILRNRGDVPLDLKPLRFDKGIRCEFKDVPKPLQPDSDLVLVRNQDAYQARHAEDSRTIAVYVGKLDNGGERLRVVDRDEHVIIDVAFDDDGPMATRSRWERGLVGAPRSDHRSQSGSCLDGHTLRGSSKGMQPDDINLGSASK